ncbi:MAG: hypothetical protein ACTSPD_09905 [Promethearchaeota archaeon]
MLVIKKFLYPEEDGVFLWELVDYNDIYMSPENMDVVLFLEPYTEEDCACDYEFDNGDGSGAMMRVALEMDVSEVIRLAGTLKNRKIKECD